MALEHALKLLKRSLVFNDTRLSIDHASISRYFPKQMKDHAYTLDHLPLDSLEYISKFLSFKDVVRCSAVSSFIYKAVHYSSVFWENKNLYIVSEKDSHYNIQLFTKTIQFMKYCIKKLRVPARIYLCGRVSEWIEFYLAALNMMEYTGEVFIHAPSNFHSQLFTKDRHVNLRVMRTNATYCSDKGTSNTKMIVRNDVVKVSLNQWCKNSICRYYLHIINPITFVELNRMLETDQEKHAFVIVNTLRITEECKAIHSNTLQLYLHVIFTISIPIIVLRCSNEDDMSLLEQSNPILLVGKTVGQKFLESMNMNGLSSNECELNRLIMRTDPLSVPYDIDCVAQLENMLERNRTCFSVPKVVSEETINGLVSSCYKEALVRLQKQQTVFAVPFRAVVKCIAHDAIRNTADFNSANSTIHEHYGMCRLWSLFLQELQESLYNSCTELYYKLVSARDALDKVYWYWNSKTSVIEDVDEMKAKQVLAKRLAEFEILIKMTKAEIIECYRAKSIYLDSTILSEWFMDNSLQQ